MLAEANWLRPRLRGLRPTGVASLAVMALVASGCSGHPSPSAGDWPLAVVSEHDVTVSLRAVVDEASHTFVTATFTPTRSGFHLYSKDLPPEGLSGVGRPTLLEVVPGGAIVQHGETVADRKPVSLYVPVLKIAFPVYPEGPVTLRLPVTLKPGADRGATFSVTYLACSDSVCLAPVMRKPVVVTLPEAFRPASS